MMKHLATFAIFVSLFAYEVAHADMERYRYRLEEGAQHEVCTHMTRVFNDKFKMPWFKGLYPDDRKGMPKVFGIPYNQVFEREPGVALNPDYTWRMLLTKYPSTPEYEAVKWRETRRTLSQDSGDRSEYPVLLAQLDIDNDGQLDWVIKDSFMDKLTTFEGWGQAFGFRDDLAIFPLDGFKPTVPILAEVLIPIKNPSKAPRHLDEDISRELDAYQLRPFIFQGKTYLSAYQVYWPNLERIKKAGTTVATPPDKEYPDREYMNIFSVLPGSYRLENSTSVTSPANTRQLCRIRMHMQKPVKPFRQPKP